MCQKPPGRVRAPAAKIKKIPRAMRLVRSCFPLGCGRPAVLGALHLSATLRCWFTFIYRYNRTPCGRGLYQRGLLDSRGSHPHLFGLLGLASLPSVSGFIIAPTLEKVKHFLKFFWAAFSTFAAILRFRRSSPQSSYQGSLCAACVAHPLWDFSLSRLLPLPVGIFFKEEDPRTPFCPRLYTADSRLFRIAFPLEQL